jgi:hypothetical protein
VTMAKNFKKLQEKMPREVRLRSEALLEKMISEMGLAERRVAMDMTQESLANAVYPDPARRIRDCLRHRLTAKTDGWPTSEWASCTRGRCGSLRSANR